ncbi:hypothetical protein Clacol_004786 [Clathrus columnatus]|uniref:Uncharacterized protein n=1 Tax=Clathrus columnatus TaxID=1419009 RepID=A0AAV5A7G5_9AGAM|nr:hypothetical protein Clacol_004786 [Clathrus columnatus]
MSTPFNSNANSLKRSRPLLPSSSHNVSSDRQDNRTRSPCSDLCLKSPTRKKRKDMNLENYTPERESTRSRGSSRRSTTPDVRYEPPSEKFTPPRNVVLDISSVKSTKTRLSTPVGLSRINAERKIVVKRERSMSPFPLPPVDLTKPPPPPSPTDDPLLLMEFPLTAKRLNNLIDVDDNMFDDSTSNAVTFDPNQSAGTDIFHSDDEMEEVGEAEGEFTGRFKYYKTPVKDDPPSSATKLRRDSWGRPISPHPRKMDQSWGDSDEEDDGSNPLASSPDESLETNPPDKLFDSGEINEDVPMNNEEPTAFDDEFILPGIVEVSSNDPRAAARAAAILKLHHSYIIDGIGNQQPRYRSPSFSRHGSVLSESNQCMDQYISPSVSYASLPEVDDYQSGKEWTKACWKTLDTCFTEERFAVAEAAGKLNTMAGVDNVRYESVVERFITQCNDSTWDRTMLLRRVQVLSKRQRSGRGAPRSVQQKSRGDNVQSVTSVPSMLLAPRYAHLRNELRSTKNSVSPNTRVSAAQDKPLEDPGRYQAGSVIPFPVPRTPEPERCVRDPPPSGTKMVLSYLGSLFSRNSSSKSRLNPPAKSLPSLPAPPEMRQLRGPVSTPAKVVIPQATNLKEIVHLNEISPISVKEFDKLQPLKDMVHLNHVEPPPSVRPRATSNPLLRDRKNSGGSVRDLVKCFEEAAKKTGNEVGVTSGRTLRKTASVSSLNVQSRWNS